MPEKLLLAITITFSLNLFLGGNWPSSTQASDTQAAEKAQLPVGSSPLTNDSKVQVLLPNFIKPPAL
ncbi:MAG: hypothetical protein KME12_20670 [Trichocoleus desertorum ATA4-8-CV12]|jgi:hypothetical protein|nr:hypothetical protein [Trichocoleus desertorum ATA4-8-CV12]